MDTLLKETVDATVNSRYPGMAPEGRKLIEDILIRKELEKGELLFKEGQVCHHMVFVGKGMMRQFYLMAEALEPCTVYLLPYDKFMRLTEISWEINMFYRKILEYSLIVSQVKADSWRFETARERYNMLMHTHPEVIKRAPLSHIASYLLMTPETLSRVRSGIL